MALAGRIHCFGLSPVYIYNARKWAWLGAFTFFCSRDHKEIYMGWACSLFPCHVPQSPFLEVSGVLLGAMYVSDFGSFCDREIRESENRCLGAQHYE